MLFNFLFCNSSCIFSHNYPLLFPGVRPSSFRNVSITYLIYNFAEQREAEKREKNELEGIIASQISCSFKIMAFDCFTYAKWCNLVWIGYSCAFLRDFLFYFLYVTFVFHYQIFHLFCIQFQYFMVQLDFANINLGSVHLIRVYNLFVL